MWTGLPNCNSREPKSAQAKTGAVVARLRRNFEARGDKQYIGYNVGRVPSLVQGTPEDPEAGSIVRRCAHRTTATQRTVHSLPEIDAEDINDPSMGKNEIATRAEQAKKETDRLRMELSEAKEQLDNGEMATAKLVHELVSSKRELNAARDELEGSATAAENAAKRVEADVATLHSELEVVRSELAGKITELNEMKPQLHLARMQLRSFQETYQQQQQTHFYHAPRQQQPQDQMGVSQYYHVLQQPQQNYVQDPSPGHLEVVELLQIRVDCMMNFVEAADGQRLNFQLPAKSRSQIVNMARSAMNWMKESSIKDELLQRIKVLDASMNQVMSNLK